MFVIMAGNPVDGFYIYGDKDGKPFESHDEALQEVESRSFTQSWWIVEIKKAGD